MAVNMNLKSPWFPWLAVLAILVILLVVFSPIVIVRSGHQGLATFFGDMQGSFLTEGMHFKYPLLRVHQFDMRTQTQDVSIGAVTKDMQLVTIGVTVSYRLDTERVRDLFEEVGTDIAAKIIDPAVKESVNEATTQFTAEELISKRDEFKTAVVAGVTEHMIESGVIVEEVAIISVGFSKTLQAAFEATNIAEQAVTTASARKQAGELEADTIEALSKVLRGNEVYIQYEIMKRWDGQSPLYLAPTLPVQIVDRGE